MVLNGCGGYIVAAQIPVGYGVLSWHFSSVVGTPEFVTTLGVNITPLDDLYEDGANVAFDAYEDAFMSTTSTNLTLEYCALTVGAAPGSVGSIQSTRAPVAGGNGSNAAPVAMAPIIQKRTANLGRTGRGRMFLPGAVADGDVGQAGELDPTFRTGLSAAAETFRATLRTGQGAASMIPYIIHTTGGGIGLAPTEITSMQAAPLVGWIRKRLR